MLIIRGVNVYPSQIEAVLIGQEGIAPHYQLVLERHGALDQVRLEVEALPAVAVADYARLADAAAHHIKSLIGVSTEVCVLAPGSVERSQGKAVRVRDLRPKHRADALIR
jgi:phenylacetate-CoA ligase